MIQATKTTPSFHILFSGSSLNTSFPGRSCQGWPNPPPPSVLAVHRQDTASRSIAGSAAAMAYSTRPVATRKRSNYEIESLTTWLLKQEQARNIDTVLTIVISIISLAYKQIASLFQRLSIINLTGGQGTINVQAKQQKKLSVVSNKIHQCTPIFMGNPDEIDKLQSFLD